MNSENETTASVENEKCSHRGWKHRRGRFLWKAPLILVFILVKGIAVFYLWNALIPELFHGPTLTYLQAIGLMVLTKLLVGFHGGGFGRWGRHRHHHMRHRWHSMSDEDRQKIREKLRSKFGHNHGR